MPEVLNPADIEARIRQVSDDIAEGVGEVSKAYQRFLAADHGHDLAYARAYMAHKGAAHEKRYQATLDTEAERVARDAADAAYRYVKDRADALKEELRAMQSVGAMVREMYSTAGVPDRRGR